MSDFAILSTGNPEDDARLIADFRRHDALISEGLCPNGCAAMVDEGSRDQRCPVCGFVYQRHYISAHDWGG